MISLEEIRKKLLRLEDKIIHSLFDRSQYKFNNIIYTKGGLEIPDFEGSFFEYLFRGTEKLHDSAGRYTDQEEHPFLIIPQKPLISRKIDDRGIVSKVNLNDKILNAYMENLPIICEDGDDNMYGSSAEADINCLQAISKRVHIGEQVAESKFHENPNEYIKLIKSKDTDGLTSKLRNIKVEEEVLERVKTKGERYGIYPTLIYNFYKRKIIPFTIEVEVNYFLSKEL